MAAALAVTAIIAWLRFFAVSWGPWGVKIDPQTAPGGVKIDPWRVPGGSWRPLSSSGGVLGGAAGVPEGSGSRLGGVLGPNGSHFKVHVGALFRILFYYVFFCVLFYLEVRVNRS